MNYTQLKLKPEYRKKLKVLADVYNRSMANTVEVLIDHYLERGHERRLIALNAQVAIYALLLNDDYILPEVRPEIERRKAQLEAKLMEPRSLLRGHPIYNVAGNSEMLGEV